MKNSRNSRANNLAPKYEIIKKINFIKKIKGKNIKQS
jgi:hypothetical protein